MRYWWGSKSVTPLLICFQHRPCGRSNVRTKEPHTENSVESNETYSRGLHRNKQYVLGINRKLKGSSFCPFMSLRVFSCYQLTNCTLGNHNTRPQSFVASLNSGMSQALLAPGKRQTGNNRSFIVIVLVCFLCVNFSVSRNRSLKINQHFSL